MNVSVIGAGAFGTALAIRLADGGRQVVLWARDAGAASAMATHRENTARLPGVTLPPQVIPTADVGRAARAGTILLAIPMQGLSGFLGQYGELLRGRRLVACCKGTDLKTLQGPTCLIAAHVPGAVPALLTGPSFAADIARGLPAALTLACRSEHDCAALQDQLSAPGLRLYRTTDTTGAELGGALKNVIAIACGITIGAGLGESARAAVMTRGYAEMKRLAAGLGGLPETLSGLSGFGDLALTCTSRRSRNYRFGLALGAGEGFDTAVTVEGAATAKAVCRLARERSIDMPIATLIAAILEGEATVTEAVATLMARPPGKE